MVRQAHHKYALSRYSVTAVKVWLVAEQGYSPCRSTATVAWRNIMPFVYILRCSDETYYTGSTWHLLQRLDEHNAGAGANYTSKRLPVVLVYWEEYDLIGEAFDREKQIQGWSRKKKEALIQGRAEDLPELARKVWAVTSIRR